MVLDEGATSSFGYFTIVCVVPYWQMSGELEDNCKHLYLIQTRVCQVHQDSEAKVENKLGLEDIWTEHFHTADS